MMGYIIATLLQEGLLVQPQVISVNILHAATSGISLLSSIETDTSNGLSR